MDTITCPNCQKQNQNDAEYCSNCGTKLPSISTPLEKVPQTKKGVDPLALTSFIVSLLSVPGAILAFMTTLIFEDKANILDISFSNWAILKTVLFNQEAIIALVLGIISLVFFKRYHLNRKGKGLAIAGVVISGIVLLFMLAILIYPLAL